MRRPLRALSPYVLLLVIGLTGCSAITHDFGSETVFGRTTSGLHDETDEYQVGLLICRADLMPPRVESVPGTTGNVADVVSAQFPTSDGWSYQSAANKLSAKTIRIRTYDVQGTSGRVGAEFHVRYQPRRGDPTDRIHWIQVYDNNHALSGATTGHGNRGNRVDIPSAATTPYYDDGYAATSGTCSPSCSLYDFPGRTDANRNHDWQAVTFLVQGPAVGAGPGQITFLRPGFRWGWKNRCRHILDYFGWILFSETRLSFTASETIEPGASARLALASPAELQLARQDSESPVVLQEAVLEIRIEELTDEFSEGEAAITRFTVAQGSGQLGELRLDGESFGQSSFEITGGEGFIQWESGEVSIELELDMGGDLPNLVATGFGRLDPEADSLILDPGFQAVEPELARQAAAKTGGVGAIE